MKNKNILIIHPLDDFYGATKILSYLIPILMVYFHVEVMVQKDRNALRKLLGEMGVEVTIREVSFLPIIHSKMFKPREIFYFLKQLLLFYSFFFNERKKYDVVYVNTFVGIVVSILCKLFSIKNIIHCHEEQSHRLFGRLLALVARKTADHIVAVSHVVEKYVRGNSKFSNVTTIWNGIPEIYPSNSNLLIDKYNLDQDKFTILLPARITREKGYWFLADAISELPSDILLNTQVLCLGSPPLNSSNNDVRFIDYIGDKGLINVFNLIGHSDQVLEFMSFSDLIIIPSIMVDPFPTTVLESFKLGKCIITTNNGGAAEIVINNHNGYLISPLDVHSLTNKIIELYENPYLLNLIGSNASITYKESLTLKAFEARFLSFINEILI